MKNELTSQQREAFKAWMTGFDHEPVMDVDPQGYYEDFSVQRSWIGWQARAQRQAVAPLTESRVHLILENTRAAWTRPPTESGTVAFARAIEAAHGIT